MQPDNYIQTPEDFLGYDRYTYCRGNPFKWTDPSGEVLLSHQMALLQSGYCADMAEGARLNAELERNMAGQGDDVAGQGSGGGSWLKRLE